MEFSEVIKARKSVRAYQDQPVEAEKLKFIVEAGNMAAGTPTVGKRIFTVISNQALIRKISETAKEIMRNSPVERARQVANNPVYDPVFHAPALIFVSVEKQDNPMLQTIAAENAAAAGENILLAATSVGLGSCYVGSPTMALNDPEIRKACGISEDLVTPTAILIGYGKTTTPHKAYPENPENINYVK